MDRAKPDVRPPVAAIPSAKINLSCRNSSRGNGSSDWRAARRCDQCAMLPANHRCAVGVLPLLREKFGLLKLILHSELRRRAASRRALPCPSSIVCIAPHGSDMQRRWNNTVQWLVEVSCQNQDRQKLGKLGLWSGLGLGLDFLRIFPILTSMVIINVPDFDTEPLVIKYFNSDLWFRYTRECSCCGWSCKLNLLNLCTQCTMYRK